MSTKRPIIKKQAPSALLDDVKKVRLMGVKAPPLYKQEYIYEVTGSGDKMIRADLFHSPTVRKSWTREEISLLLDLGMVRLIQREEACAIKKSRPSGAHGPCA